MCFEGHQRFEAWYQSRKQCNGHTICYRRGCFSLLGFSSCPVDVIHRRVCYDLIRSVCFRGWCQWCLHDMQFLAIRAASCFISAIYPSDCSPMSKKQEFHTKLARHVNTWSFSCLDGESGSLINGQLLCRWQICLEIWIFRSNYSANAWTCALKPQVGMMIHLHYLGINCEHTRPHTSTINSSSST